MSNSESTVGKRNRPSRPSLLKELLRSKSGVIGIVIIIILVGLTLYSLYFLPANLPQKWQNGDAWVLNPVDAPPAWVSIFGANTAPTLDLSFSHWNATPLSGGGNLTYYVYSSSVSFTWSSSDYPQNLGFVPQYQGQASTATINWTKPSGSFELEISQLEAGRAYQASDTSVVQAASNYVLTQTGTYYSTLSPKQTVTAYFGTPGKNILSSPVEKGTYTVQIEILSTEKLTMSSSPVVVTGNSYGTMGTDNEGRPIDLGVLAGLPNALEIGFLVAIVSVVWGILFGGLSGYFGAKKDSIMQWANLVVLAMPVLPFLVVMSYTVRLSVVIEVFLIAALSWPFYAIIARTVALSVKSQPFIEADKAMGIPPHRTFLSHFLPRLVPVTVAYTVLGIPAGILLAETLSFLNIVPPNLITWGGILDQAFTSEAAVFGFWWWVVFPGLMIVVAAIPFVLIGFALERIIAPRVAAK